MTISDFLAIFFFLMVIQSVGTYFQVKKYKKTISKLHKLGNLGIGSNRRRFGAGNIIIIACDAEGVITGAEQMKGMTIFSSFKPVPELIGKNIYDLKAKYQSLPDKQKNSYKAHLQAVEALESRLKGGDNLESS